MTFESPWMLLGAAALAAVLWTHLSTRREARIEFPAVKLLAKVARHRAHRLKLRSMLLLVLRLLAVAALVLAAGRPGVAVSRPGGIRSGLALAQVIVLDDSLSMRRAVDGSTTAFEAARAAALEELDRLRPGDASTVVLSGYPARAVTGGVGFDLDPLRRALETATAGFRSGDIEGALRIAGRALRESQLSQREVVILTDLCESGWEDEPFAPKDGVGLRVIDVAPGPVPANTAITAVEVKPIGDGASREVAIEARAVNNGGEIVTAVEIVLEIDGAIAARGTLDLPPHGFAIKRFHHRFEREGSHRGLVRLGADPLPDDNARHFSVFVRRSLTALVIDGDLRPGSYRDEAFYLRHALETPSPGEVPIRTMVVDAKTASATPLSGNDVVFVVGVQELPAPLGSRLEQYVRAGGGLFVSPGSHGGVAQDQLRILPAKVRSIRTAARPASAFCLGAVDRAHRIFAAFGDGATGLEDVRVTRHLLVEPDPSFERAIIADMEGALPLLLERRVDKGAVLLLTTTIDRDWTDLPIRPGFLPLVQRSARYLAGRLEDRETRRVLVGRAVDLEVSEGMQRMLVLAPDGEETIFAAKELAGQPRVRFGGTKLPGSYRVWAEAPGFGGLRELPQLEFVVEVDPAESDLTRIAAASEETRGAEVALPGVEGRLPIWPYLLTAAVVLLLVETGLAGLWLRRSHSGR